MKQSLNPAPIALFGFNRPVHISKLLACLLSNPLASESDLFIFIDGARDSTDSALVKEVREISARASGFKSVSIYQNETNRGLANSIIFGVNYVLSLHDRVIVLEDDLILSASFLAFMNSALDFYADNERVISISGYTPRIELDTPFYFMRGADCWGWATWRRGWEIFEPDGKVLLAAVKEKKIEHLLNLDGCFDFSGMLTSQINGVIDSWAIRWHVSAFIKDRLTLCPSKTLVLNNGLDGSGTHCAETKIFKDELYSGPIPNWDDCCEETISAREQIKMFWRSKRRITRFVGSLMRKLCI